MRLNRKSSIVLALGIIVLFFTIARLTAPTRIQPASLPPSDISVPSPAPSATAESTSDTESRFELQNFQRSESRDGKKVWEVVADRGKFYPEADVTTLTNAIVTSLRDDDSKMIITAESADISLTGTTLDTALLQKHVTVTLQEDVILTTSEATYSHAAQSVVAPNAVDIQGPFYTSRGDSMTADTEEQIITLTGAVRTEIEPVPSDKEKHQ